MSPFFLFVLTKCYIYIEKWNRKASHSLAIMYDLHLRCAEHSLFVHVSLLEDHGDGFIVLVISGDHHDSFMEMRVKRFPQRFDFLHAEAFHDLDELFLQELEALYIRRAAFIFFHMRKRQLEIIQHRQGKKPKPKKKRNRLP